MGNESDGKTNPPSRIKRLTGLKAAIRHLLFRQPWYLFVAILQILLAQEGVANAVTPTSVMIWAAVSQEKMVPHDVGGLDQAEHLLHMLRRILLHPARLDSFGTEALMTATSPLIPPLYFIGDRNY